MRILGVYMLLKVVSHYDFSFLSMSVMGLQKKFGCMGGWVGGVNFIQFYFGYLVFVIFAKPLTWSQYLMRQPKLLRY